MCEKEAREEFDEKNRLKYFVFFCDCRTREVQVTKLVAGQKISADNGNGGEDGKNDRVRWPLS